MNFDIKKYLAESGAVRNGHFELSSGLHSEKYIQCALALKNPEKARIIGRKLRALWKSRKPDIIVSPAIGGIIIGHETAKAFGTDFLFAERNGKKLELRRGFDIKPGMKAIIVEDVFTTGKSTMETAVLIKKYGGKVIGALSIINRSEKNKLFSFPYKSLLKMKIKTYSPKECPFCKKGIKKEKPGSRKAEK